MGEPAARVVDEVIAGRKVVRSFTSEPVSRESLVEMLDLARRAPSAGWSQGVSFLAIDDPQKLADFWKISLPEQKRPDFPWPNLLNAPAVVLAVAEPEAYFLRYSEADKPFSSDPKNWKIPFWLVDSAFSVQNLLLLAHSRGLGALFFGIFENEAEIKAAFQIPPQNELLGAVAIGHTDHKTERPSKSLKRGRRDIDEVIHFNGWGS